MAPLRPTVSLLSVLLALGCATGAERAAPATVTPPAVVATPDASARFQALLHEEWEYGLQQAPTFASSLGDKRYQDKLPDLSPAAFEARRAHARELVGRIEAIDPAQLPESERLHYTLFLDEAKEDVESQRFPSELLPISQLGGLHTMLPSLAQSQPPRSVADVDAFLSRLRQYPALVDHTLGRMQAGLEKGITPPQITLNGVEATMKAQLPGDPAQSPIVAAAFATRPTEISESDWAAQRQRVIEAVREVIYPANQKLLAFWTGTYFPRTRTSLALSELPDGTAWYAFNARSYTTTDRTPAEIHQIGLSEVKRIRAQMEAVKVQAGFAGSLSQFFEFMRKDPRFFYKTREELLAGYRDIAKRIDPELPRLFLTLPRLTYGVEPVPSYAEKTAPAAYYRRGSLEAGRAGVFFANTYDLQSRPKWEMEALCAHEAVPGHHFQLAVAQELGELPLFRRYGGYTAYTEGWGLYAESLGAELGLYKDPYSRMGQLTLEMWRAIRLVVDTGLHAQGWSRDQAIGFFLENAPKPRHEAEVEVDRYIVMPGQALAYKMGELELQRLRVHAKQTLGERFDLRAFHDALLGEGPLPLDVLATRIDSWIARRASASP